MNTIPTLSPHSSIMVYFNNGVNANRPWWVGVKEGRAISATFGDFPDALAAIAYAVPLCRLLHAPLVVPPWLTWLATAIKHASAASDYPNDFDARLAALRRGKVHTYRMDEATLAAIEDEWIGLDFCRQPFLY